MNSLSLMRPWKAWRISVSVSDIAWPLYGLQNFGENSPRHELAARAIKCGLDGNTLQIGHRLNFCRRKKLVEKNAAKYAKLKAIADDESRDETERLIARLKMAELPRNGNPTRVRNRCELTGRSRAYYRKFRLSRIMLRELANKGLIPGVTKSSW